MDNEKDKPVEKWKFNPLEHSFILLAIALHIQGFTNVYLKASDSDNTSLSFWIAFIVCIISFVHLVIRYFFVTHKYNSESSMRAWLISIFLMMASYCTIFSVLSTENWFIFYGLLNITASIKDNQVKQAALRIGNFSKASIQRLDDAAIGEFIFGVVLLFIYFLGNTNIGKVIGFKDNYQLYLLGLIVSLFATLLIASVTINSARKNIGIIETINKDGQN